MTHPSLNRWFAWIDYTKNLESVSYDIVLHFVSRISKSATILDFGCGSGWATIFVLKNKTQAFGVGIEISRKLTMEAVRNAEKQGLKSRCDFIVCDCSKLPFLNSSFDAVIELNVLHHLSSIQPGLISICRALKDKGYVLMAESVINNPLVLLGRYLSAQWNLFLTSGTEINFTSNQLALALEHTGFNIMKKGYDNYILGSLKYLTGHYPGIIKILPKHFLLILIYFEKALQRTPLLKSWGGTAIFLCQWSKSKYKNGLRMVMERKFPAHST